MYNPKLSRPLIFIIVTAAIILVLATLLATGHQTGVLSGHLVVFDADLSGSVLGWTLAIPILILVFALVLVALTGAGVIVLGALALALVAVLLSLLFAILLAVLPLAAFLAMPILIVVGMVKLFNQKRMSGA